MYCWDILPQFLLNPPLTHIIDLLIFGHNYSFPDSEALLSVVIDEWPLSSVSHHSHPSKHECFRGTHVPVFEAGHQIQVVVWFLVQQVHCFVASTRYPRYANWIDSFKELVHALLVAVERTTDPHIVVFILDSIIRWERHQRSHSLESTQLLREFVFDEDTTLRSTKIGATLVVELVIEWFMDYANPWSAFDTHTYHASYMVQMALSKTFGSI